MIKRSGASKIVDVNSALDMNNMPEQRTCTPQYAAPEMLERNEFTPRADLASLGYVLIELLAGRPLFTGLNSLGELLEAKWTLPQRLERILPDDVADSDDGAKELLFLDLLERGYYVARRGFIALSSILTDEQLDGFLDALDDVIAKLGGETQRCNS